MATATLCVAGYVFVYATGRANPPVRSDGFSYYVYLPSWFIYGDSTLAAVARDCCGGEFDPVTAIIRWPDTRQWVNAHPIPFHEIPWETIRFSWTISGSS